MAESPVKKKRGGQMSTELDGPHGNSAKRGKGGRFKSARPENSDEGSQIVLPSVTSSGELIYVPDNKTPTKEKKEETLVYSSFPSHIIPETLGRVTRTPTEGDQLAVRRMNNGRLRIRVRDFDTKSSSYCAMAHMACFVCSRQLEPGEMHLNFPTDLDRRRIWANLLGFKYKDILRIKTSAGGVCQSSGPICTEHFTEECFRMYNFNKAAIEAFGVPVAISPDVKTTPSKKRVPWVCSVCPDYNSCSVVDLQQHMLEHTAKMSKSFSIPPAGFMCPFCRRCTYGYRTINGFRRHLLSPPTSHCHLKRIFEFAKMNCRSSELEPHDSWDNWTRRNVYVAYHGCEPPADEVVAYPSPFKSPNYLEQSTSAPQAEPEKKKKAVRALGFDDIDKDRMQRAIRKQIRIEEHSSTSPEPKPSPEKKEKATTALELPPNNSNTTSAVGTTDEDEEEEQTVKVKAVKRQKPRTPKKTPQKKGKRGRRSHSLENNSKKETSQTPEPSSAMSSIFSSPMKPIVADAIGDDDAIEAALKQMLSTRTAAFRKMMSSRIPIVTKRRQPKSKNSSSGDHTPKQQPSEERSLHLSQEVGELDEKMGSCEPEMEAHTDQEKEVGKTMAALETKVEEEEADDRTMTSAPPEPKPKSLIAQAVAAGRQPPPVSFRLRTAIELPMKRTMSDTEDSGALAKKADLGSRLVPNRLPKHLLRSRPAVLRRSQKSASEGPPENGAEVSCQPQTLMEALLQSTTSSALPSIDRSIVDQPLFNDPALARYHARRQIESARNSKRALRQVEAVEARVRLFGDTADVPIPEGYEVVQTPQGLRVMEIDQWGSTSDAVGEEASF